MRLPVQSLTRATLWVGVFGLGRAILSLAVRVAAGRRFGVGSGEIDAYMAALRLPQLVGDFLVGGTLYYAVIPCLQEARQRHGEAAAWRLARTVMFRAGVLLAAASMGYFVLAEAATRLMAPDLPRLTRDLAEHLSRVMSPMFLLMGMVVIEGGVVQSQRHFSLAAAGSILPPAATLAALWLLAPRVGVAAWAWGSVAGTLGQAALLVALLWWSGLRPGREPAPAECLKSAWRLAGVGAAAIGLGLVHDLVQTRLASGVVGGLTLINYSAGLAALVYGQMMAPLMTTIYPLLSEQAASRQWRLLRDSASVGLRVGLFVLVPAALGLWLFGKDAISLVFEGGSFRSADSGALAGVLAVYSINLPASLLLDVVSRAIYGLQDARAVLMMKVVRAVAAVAINYALFLAWSVWGLALAVALVNAVEGATGCALLARRGIRLLEPADLASMGRIVAVGLGAFAAGHLAAAGPWVQSGGAGARLAVGLGVAGAAYLAASALLRSRELGLVADRLSRLWR